MLTDVADNTKLGSRERVRVKEALIQASHTTAAPKEGSRVEEADRRVQEAEKRAQNAEYRARQAEARVSEAELEADNERKITESQLREANKEVARVKNQLREAEPAILVMHLLERVDADQNALAEFIAFLKKQPQKFQFLIKILDPPGKYNYNILASNVASIGKILNIELHNVQKK